MSSTPDYRLPWYVATPMLAVSAAEVGAFLGWRGAVGFIVASIAMSLFLWRRPAAVGEK